MDHNWLNPKDETRPVGEKGWGSFAVEPVAAGETVAGFGGVVVYGVALAEYSDC